MGFRTSLAIQLNVGEGEFSADIQFPKIAFGPILIARHSTGSDGPILKLELSPDDLSLFMEAYVTVGPLFSAGARIDIKPDYWQIAAEGALFGGFLYANIRATADTGTTIPSFSVQALIKAGGMMKVFNSIIRKIRGVVNKIVGGFKATFNAVMRVCRKIPRFAMKIFHVRCPSWPALAAIAEQVEDPYAPALGYWQRALMANEEDDMMQYLNDQDLNADENVVLGKVGKDSVDLLHSHAALYVHMSSLLQESEAMDAEKPDYLTEEESVEMDEWEPSAEDQFEMWKTPYEKQDEESVAAGRQANAVRTYMMQAASSHTMDPSSDLAQAGYGNPVKEVERAAKAAARAVKRAAERVYKRARRIALAAARRVLNVFNRIKRGFYAVVHKIKYFAKMIWKLIKHPASIFGVCYAYFEAHISKASAAMTIEINGWVLGKKQNLRLHMDMKSIVKSVIGIFNTIFGIFKSVFAGGMSKNLKCVDKKLAPTGTKKGKTLSKMKLPDPAAARAQQRTLQAKNLVKHAEKVKNEKAAEKKAKEVAYKKSPAGIKAARIKKCKEVNHKIHENKTKAFEASMNSMAAAKKGHFGGAVQMTSAKEIKCDGSKKSVAPRKGWDEKKMRL
jgi:hypothetical protein